MPGSVSGLVPTQEVPRCGIANVCSIAVDKPLSQRDVVYDPDTPVHVAACGNKGVVSEYDNSKQQDTHADQALEQTGHTYIHGGTIGATSLRSHHRWKAKRR